VPGDPIGENPLATWFVRPPSGGQFGPARGEVMRKWLTEGRVTADSLVWREGWIDWLAATEVFPQLGKTPAPAAMFGLPTGTKPVTSSSFPTGRKPASGAMGAALLVALALICVILVGVLAVVLSGGFGST
jgi:site-specific recombinase